MNSIDPSLYFNDDTLCKELLGRHLYDGSLALFLGAGVSASLGFPNWRDLTINMLKETGLEDEVSNLDDSTSAHDYRKLADKIRRSIGSDSCEFKRVIKNSLYPDGQLFDLGRRVPPLLSALGAMLMGSQRGSVDNVVTFNFDNSLEEYLNLHGFRVQTISELPILETKSDVTIYHPHGYLPFGDEAEDSEEIIFDQYSYNKTMGAAQDSPWRALVRKLLYSKLILVVGLSEEDPNLQSLTTSVKEDLAKQGIERPAGVWLLGPSDKSEAEEIIRDNCNFIPLRLKEYDDYASFLLSVCQEASRL